MGMENPPFMDDFLIETSIYMGFPDIFWNPPCLWSQPSDPATRVAAHRRQRSTAGGFAPRDPDLSPTVVTAENCVEVQRDASHLATYEFTCVYIIYIYIFIYSSIHLYNVHINDVYIHSNICIYWYIQIDHVIHVQNMISTVYFLILRLLGP